MGERAAGFREGETGTKFRVTYATRERSETERASKTMSSATESVDTGAKTQANVELNGSHDAGAAKVSFHTSRRAPPRRARRRIDTKKFPCSESLPVFSPKPSGARYPSRLTIRPQKLTSHPIVPSNHVQSAPVLPSRPVNAPWSAIVKSKPAHGGGNPAAPDDGPNDGKTSPGPAAASDAHGSAKASKVNDAKEKHGNDASDGAANPAETVRLEPAGAPGEAPRASCSGPWRPPRSATWAA